MLFAGLLVFGIFSECVNRAPSLMLQNPGFVKRVVFPLEIMPWVVLCSSLFHTLISLAVLALVMLIGLGALPPTWPLIVVVLLPLVLFVSACRGRWRRWACTCATCRRRSTS